MVANMDQVIKLKRWRLSQERLEAEFKEWASDISYSRTMDTKIFKFIELYWLNNIFIAQVEEEKGSQQQVIMYKMNVMDKKIDSISREVLILRSQLTDTQRIRPILSMKWTESHLLQVLL